MNIARILNRAAAVALSPTFEIPKDGKFHLARKGEFPGIVETPDGKTFNVIQVLDDQAFASMVNRFKKAKEAGGPDLLVDRDHLSSDPENETIAEGWIQNVETTNADLFADIRLSAQGEADIKGGNYRFISGVWDVVPIDQDKFTEGCRVRPIQLTEAGLTNRPNIKGLAALSNRRRADSPTNLPDDPANTPAVLADIQNRNKKTMKQIATKLGLSAEASEDAILGELATLQNRATEAEKKLLPVTEELAAVKNRLKETEEANADAALESAGIKKDDPDHAIIRTAIIANREGGLAMLKRIKPAAAKPAPETSRLTNRATAKAPNGTIEGNENAADPKAEARAGAIRNRANQIKKQTPSLTHHQAWQQAKSEILAEGVK